MQKKWSPKCRWTAKAAAAGILVCMGFVLLIVKLPKNQIVLRNTIFAVSARPRLRDILVVWVLSRTQCIWVEDYREQSDSQKSALNNLPNYEVHTYDYFSSLINYIAHVSVQDQEHMPCQPMLIIATTAEKSYTSWEAVGQPRVQMVDTDIVMKVRETEPNLLSQPIICHLRYINNILEVAIMVHTALMGDPISKFVPVNRASFPAGVTYCITMDRLSIYAAIYMGCIPVVATRPHPPLALACKIPYTYVLLQRDPGQLISAPDLSARLQAIRLLGPNLHYGRGGIAWQGTLDCLANHMVPDRLAPLLSIPPHNQIVKTSVKSSGDKDDNISGYNNLVIEPEEGFVTQDNWDHNNLEPWEMVLQGRLFSHSTQGDAYRLPSTLPDHTAAALAAVQAIATSQHMGNKSTTILATYRRLHRTHGALYITDIQQGDAHAQVTVVQAFGKNQTVAMTLVNNRMKSALYMVVTVKGRPVTVQRFAHLYAQLHKHDPNLHLIITCFVDCAYIQAIFKAILLPQSYIELLVVFVTGTFSRAKGLQEGALHAPPGSLLFFCDVDMIITPGSLRRCRMHSSPGVQAYFPLVYSLYPGQFSVGPNSGFFREMGYGMACFYQDDFFALRGYGNESLWQTWGGEDKYLFFRFLQAPRVAVFRAYEPGMVHLWHSKECAAELPHPMAVNCLRVMKTHLGSQRHLAALLYNLGYHVFP